jgi:putative sterol carrier protein
MSEVLNVALAALSAKLPNGFSSVAKFVLEGEGSIIADPDGVRLGDDEADVTLIASPETFKGILEGDVNPTMAFMTGKLKIDGAMGLAMQLGSALS